MALLSIVLTVTHHMILHLLRKLPLDVCISNSLQSWRRELQRGDVTAAESLVDTAAGRKYRLPPQGQSNTAMKVHGRRGFVRQWPAALSEESGVLS